MMIKKITMETGNILPQEEYSRVDPKVSVNKVGQTQAHHYLQVFKCSITQLQTREPMHFCSGTFLRKNSLFSYLISLFHFFLNE